MKPTRYYRTNNSDGLSIWRSREHVQEQTFNCGVIFGEQTSLPLQTLQPVCCCLATITLIVSCIPFNVRCSERVYAACKFKNRVAYYPFDDHSAPPLILIEAFCQDVVSLTTISSSGLSIHHTCTVLEQLAWSLSMYCNINGFTKLQVDI